MSERKILRAAKGVTLTEVCLFDEGTIVARGYSVQSRSTPEAWDFANLAEAEARYRDEVSKSG
jgi:hypothetical protein